MKIIEKALRYLKLREFVGLATADKDGIPSSIPKLLLKIDGKTVYFVDYSIGKTAENLRTNPKISFSLVDAHSLFGYKFDGSAEIIQGGEIYDKCLKELEDRKIELTTERLIAGLHTDSPHKEFETEIPTHFLVYRVNIEVVYEISPRGEIKQEMVS